MWKQLWKKQFEMRLNIYTYIHVVIRRNMYTCVDSYVIIYYKLVFCNHNTMRGSCCLRCIHLLFLLIFLLSISTLSINLYLSTFSINLSLPDLSLSFYVSTSPTSPTSLSLINSLPTCLALSTSVAAWRLPLLASQNASTFRHRLSLFDPRFEVPMFAPRRSPKCWNLPAIVQVPRKCKEPFFKDE